MFVWQKRRSAVTVLGLLLGVSTSSCGWVEGEREAARQEARVEIEALLTERIDAADRLAR